MSPDDLRQASDLLTSFFDEGRSAVFSRGAVLLDYYVKPSDAFLIISGKVKVSSYTKSGRERVHYIYKEKELFPLAYIFSGELHEIIFIAYDEVTVKQRSIEDTREFFSNHHIALFAVVDQQTNVFKRVLNMNLESAEEKLAYGLLVFCDRFGKKQDGQILLDLSMTIQDLSDNVHLSRETTGRILKKFEEKGMMVAGRHSIIIYPDKLSKVIGD